MPGDCIQEDEAALQTLESARTYNPRRGLRSTSADISTLIQHSEVVHSQHRGLPLEPKNDDFIFYYQNELLFFSSNNTGAFFILLFFYK